MVVVEMAVVQGGSPGRPPRALSRDEQAEVFLNEFLDRITITCAWSGQMLLHATLKAVAGAAAGDLRIDRRGDDEADSPRGAAFLFDAVEPVKPPRSSHRHRRESRSRRG